MSWDKELQGWWLTTLLPKYASDSFLASMLGESTKHASWHLQTLAVDPEYQRKRRSGQTARKPSNAYTKMGFHLMPKDNSGPDSCKAAYTGVKGHSVPMWVLVMG
ncbi:hypothetical protein B0H16DRAFT_1469758 [Mycena metata]|uniref:Uncharacterized protein n=1 Tax=Mycena metata TaxID=1033252 RepID=A0AAD7HX41_9AGAR|nr:hypothetical protein B0H16DRAFT_1469758 [Mycena metata]